MKKEKGATEGAPAGSAGVMRVSLSLLLLLCLTGAAAALPPKATAQSSEGTVQAIPAISVVPWEDGPFTVFVTLADLAHDGRISYDDDRDTVPDRAAPSVGMAAFEFAFTFDPAVVTVVRAERGPDLGRSGRTFQCFERRDAPESFAFGCVSLGTEPPGPQGDLTLASVTLQPVGGGSTFLLLDASLAGPLGDGIPVQVVGGAARVTGGPPPAATATPRRRTTPRLGEPTATPRRRGTPGSEGEPANPLTPAATTIFSGPAAATATAKSAATATAAAARGAVTPTPTASDGEEPAGAVATSQRGGSSGGGDAVAAGGNSRSAGRIALWSLAAVAGLVLAGVALMLATGRLGRGRLWPPGPLG